jgi:hypothetical protein
MRKVFSAFLREREGDRMKTEQEIRELLSRVQPAWDRTNELYQMNEVRGFAQAGYWLERRTRLPGIGCALEWMLGDVEDFDALDGAPTEQKVEEARTEIAEYDQDIGSKTDRS